MNCVQETKRAFVARSGSAAGDTGVQGQFLIPHVTHASCGASGISAGMVNMPGGGMSRAHYHARSEIVVVCLRGDAATLIGSSLTPYYHGPGDFMYIPEGVVHVAVNLSATSELIAIEMRTDPAFNDDVILSPEHDARARAVAAQLREGS